MKKTKTNDTPEYSADDRVIIFGGVVDTNGLLDSTIQTGTVIEAGDQDLLVSVSSSSNYQIVSKKLCLPLKADPDLLSSATPLKPQLGDMVYFRGRESWRYTDEITVVGAIYEIAYAGGRPHKAKVYSGSEMKELDYDSLMVLQRKS
jgi:hypothetical protein